MKYNKRGRLTSLEQVGPAIGWLETFSFTTSSGIEIDEMYIIMSYDTAIFLSFEVNGKRYNLLNTDKYSKTTSKLQGIIRGRATINYELNSKDFNDFLSNSNLRLKLALDEELKQNETINKRVKI